jgi:hypothetical protein
LRDLSRVRTFYYFYWNAKWKNDDT